MKRLWLTATQSGQKYNQSVSSAYGGWLGTAKFFIIPLNVTNDKDAQPKYDNGNQHIIELVWNMQEPL